jgi:hypothetical protein
MRTIWGGKIEGTSMSDNEICDFKFDIHRVPITAVKRDWFRDLQRRVWDR